MKNILIIGYGKIGSLKSDIYNSLGFNVQVFDPYKRECSYNAFIDFPREDISDDYLFDICTPTGRHIIDLQKILELKPDAKVLIEKPLCNSPKHYEKYKYLLSKYPECEVHISENYLYSDTILKVKEYLINNNLDIKSIKIEFSKDRRQDILKGRFVDKKLGSIGIEVPHMLSILYSLGLYDIKIDKVKMTDKNESSFQEEFCLFANSGNAEIFLYQSLTGEYKLRDEHFLIPGNDDIQCYRVIVIETDNGEEIFVQLDPFPKDQRYFSKISFLKENLELRVYDNSLRNIIEDFTTEERKGLNPSEKKSFMNWQTENLFKLVNCIQ